MKNCSYCENAKKRIKKSGGGGGGGGNPVGGGGGGWLVARLKTQILQPQKGGQCLLD